MLVNRMGCYFSKRCVSLRDGVLKNNGRDINIQDEVLVYRMGC